MRVRRKSITKTHKKKYKKSLGCSHRYWIRLLKCSSPESINIFENILSTWYGDSSLNKSEIEISIQKLKSINPALANYTLSFIQDELNWRNWTGENYEC